MSLCYNNAVRYEYQYTSDGKLHSVTDISSGVGYLYEYDSEDRLSGYAEYKLNDKTNTLGIKYTYNEKNQISHTQATQDYVFGTDKQTVFWFTDYFYNEENDLLEEFYVSSDAALSTNGPSDIAIEFTYDTLQRLSKKVNTVEGSSTFTNTVNYTYNDNGNALSSQVKTYSTKTGSYAATTYTYTYDAKGNITQIVDNAGKVTKYTYDDLNQLIREDNPYLNKSYVFAYDNNGNRTSRKIYAYTTGTLGEATTTTTYTHGDSTWGDRLTKYNSSSITYDEIGNPLHYYNGFNYNFTWSDGRRLATATKGSHTFSFTYNDEGIRTSKTVDGVKHTYVLNGSQIVSEQWGNYFIAYIYDESGAPIGMHYRTNSMAANVFETYYFEKNLQGDVIAVYNASGTKLVSYTYDAWGNCTTTYYNGGASTGAQYNPFRYRGYYYDTGLEFYYLNSRYYDSRTGRFINADGVLNGGIGLLSYNQFAYCSNNPVNYTDPTGCMVDGITLPYGKDNTETTLQGGWVAGGGGVILSIWVIEKLISTIGNIISDLFSNDGITFDEKETDKNGNPIVKPGEQPTENDGYIAPKGGPKKGKTKDGKSGWVDKNGNIWVPVPTGSPDAHGGGHWDVQSPGGGYTNVYPGNVHRGGRSPFPNIPN